MAVTKDNSNDDWGVYNSLHKQIDNLTQAVKSQGAIIELHKDHIQDLTTELATMRHQRNELFIELEMFKEDFASVNEINLKNHEVIDSIVFGEEI
jgi:hypothetical protein